MNNIDTRKYLIASMGLTIVPIAIAGVVFHLSLIFIIVPALFVLIATVYFGKGLYPRRRSVKSSFWAFILLSLIFLIRRCDPLFRRVSV